MWKPKTSLLLVVTVFLATEKQFIFHLSDIPGCENSFSVKWKRIFLTNSSSRLVETVFMSSGNSILLFRVLLKFLKFGASNFLKINLIPARGN